MVVAEFGGLACESERLGKMRRVATGRKAACLGAPLERYGILRAFRKFGVPLGKPCCILCLCRARLDQPLPTGTWKC